MSKELSLMDERISRLLDELGMAIHWQRPCIIIAVYRSELILHQLHRQLEQALSAFNQRITQIRVNNRQYDIPLILIESDNREATVFLVTELRWGGGKGKKNAYKALNIHREHIVDSPVRVILALTQKEASSLSRYAPDFWAFRHRVFEFLEFPPRTDENCLFHDIVLGKWNPIRDAKNSFGEIEKYEKMINELPPLSEARRLEAEYHGMIGAFLWANQDFTQAIRRLEKSLEIAQNINDLDGQKDYFTGLGIIHQSMGNYTKAAAAYQNVIQINDNDFLACTNLASVFLGMGNLSKAVDAAQSVTKYYPKYSDAWLVMGNIFCALGCFEDAVDSYQRSIRLAPDDVRPRIHLGVLLLKWGNPKLASRYLASDR